MAQAAVQRYPLFENATVEIGKIQRLGTGANHQNYLFWVKTNPPRGGVRDRIFVLRRMEPAHPEAPPQRACLRNEALTLQELSTLPLSFNVPKVVGFAEIDPGEGEAAVQTVVLGVVLETYRRIPDRAPFMIDTIAHVAKAVHHLPIDSFSHLPHYADSRSHVTSRLQELSESLCREEPDAQNALHWIEDHLPADRPAVLLHGGLEAQNMLWDQPRNRVGVINWEFARIGDPACDLAMVTRGNLKLFGCQNGLKKLLRKYLEAGGLPITAVDVINHELILTLSWFHGALQNE
jgi:aminoglycoside phosphotransferase (APT) family kinase protein